MRFLWPIANWKRTGPVEPSLDLAAAMARAGHEVLVATGRPEGQAPDDAGEAAEARGLHRLHAGLLLSKHIRRLGNRRDVGILARQLRARPPDAVVSTIRNDHRLLARALSKAGCAAPLVRLWFDDGTTPPSKEEARLLASAHRVAVFGRRPAEVLAGLGLPPARVVRLDPPLDLARIRRAAGDTEAARGRWRSGFDGLLVGLVARVQPHRRFELLWDALALAKAAGTPVRVLVVGRGTSFEEVAAAPVRRRGLGDLVVFPGYLRGAAYAATLGALDAQLFLVPGSDPTCRALREGMALGVPSLATRRGLLPDLVEDGRTGLLFDEEPAALHAALARLAGDGALTHRLGEGALARSAAFDVARVAAALEAAVPSAVRGEGRAGGS
jgi:glycosyltransferase involved in cell wall biosynthesis